MRGAPGGPFANPPAEEIYARKWVIWSVVMIGLFMALIDITIVNISIPQLQHDLHAGVDRVSWVLNAYNIAFAVLLVAMGRLADQFGRKRLFLIGMSVFTAGSLLCSLAWSIDSLIAFRVLQGIGAATLAPIALAMTTLVFPPHQRGLGLSLMAAVANGAAVLGPPLGGVLTEYAGWPWSVGWHWIFVINVPIGVAGVFLGLRLLPETRDTSTVRQVDWWGMALIGAAVFCLTYALVDANRQGWGSGPIIGLLVAAVVLAIAFAGSQRMGRHPMLTAGLVRNRQFAGACAAMLLFGVAMMGATFMVVLALVNLWGYSEIQAALTMTALPVAGLLVAPFVARSADRVAPRLLGVPALLLVSGGLWWASSFSATPDLPTLLGPLLVLGVGIGAMFPAVNVGAMGAIRGQELGLGSGIVNMSRQLGFALGVAVLVAVFAGGFDPGASAGGSPEAAAQARDAFADAFRVAAVTSMAAIVPALSMRRRPGEGFAPVTVE